MLFLYSSGRWCLPLLQSKRLWWWASVLWRLSFDCCQWTHSRTRGSVLAPGCRSPHFNSWFGRCAVISRGHPNFWCMQPVVTAAIPSRQSRCFIVLWKPPDEAHSRTNQGPLPHPRGRNQPGACMLAVGLLEKEWTSRVFFALEWRYCMLFSAWLLLIN